MYAGTPAHISYPPRYHDNLSISTYQWCHSAHPTLTPCSSRRASARFRPARTTVSAGRLVAIDAAVTAPDHHFVVDLPDEPLWARGDREGLHQLLANLLANARVHTPAGVTVTTTLRARVQDGRQTVELTVSDDGPGIPPAVLPNLFDRFVRADKSRSRQLGSTGLGLAIVRSIVEAHNGTVSVASVPGRTAFTVRLPASGPTV